jgi:hypothetical protein
MACKMYPPASSFGFKGVTLGTTPVSRVRTPLLVFLVEMVSVENTRHILAKVETEVEKILGSFGPKEYDALTTAKLPNGERLNRVFEQMGLAYALRPLPGSEASQMARKSEKLRCQRNQVQKGRRLVQSEPLRPRRCHLHPR